MSATLILAAALLAVVLIAWRATRDEKHVIASFAAKHGWDITDVEPRAQRRRQLNAPYAVRYRDSDGRTHETLLLVNSGVLRVTADELVPADIAAAMHDVTRPMTCRVCRAAIPAGVARCPACRNARTVFMVGDTPFGNPASDTVR